MASHPRKPTPAKAVVASEADAVFLLLTQQRTRRTR
jgi:hypothetical protein